MIDKIKELTEKYKGVLAYLVIGVLTTAVDTVVYYVPGVSSIDIVELRNTIAWAAAVLFAFWGNRTFVFTDNTKGRRVTFREFYEFVLSRVFSLIISNIVIALLTKVFGMSADWAKIPTSVIVVILNYITGKIVFRKKK